MAVTPTGPLSEPLAALATALSLCPEWQAWCGAAGNAATALTHVHYVGVDESTLLDEDGAADSAKWPVAVVSQGPRYGAHRDGVGSVADGMLDGGALELDIYSLISSSYVDTYGDAFFEHWNRIGQLLRVELPQYGRTLNIRGLKLRGRPQREGEQEPTAYYVSRWYVVRGHHDG